MAWAVHQETQRATYIGMLARNETGLACNCVCPACGALLQAVNAGIPPEDFLQPHRLRPSFRHHTGAQSGDCLLRIAQIAALQLLLGRQEIDLPAPVARRSVVGASGAVYTYEASGYALRARIATHATVDAHAARITLEDGRVILLQLRGRIASTNDGEVDAVVAIDVDDPEVSTWPPDKILRHAQLDGQWLCWERHWTDSVLQAEALEQAQSEARRFVDLGPAGYLMPDGLTPLQRSESVLHWVVKDILGAARQIKVPALREVITRRMPDGNDEARVVSIPAMTLALSNVRVEHDLGELVPDVMCDAMDPAGRIPSMELLIEVAVTHRVSGEKKGRVVERGVGCVEVDTSLLNAGGRVTVERLKMIVLDVPDNKRWIHHPALQLARDRAQDELASLAVQIEEVQIEAKRQKDWFRQLPLDQALREYFQGLREQWHGRTASGRSGDALSPETMVVLLEAHGFRLLGDRLFAGAGGLLRKLYGIRAAAQKNASIQIRYESLRDALDEDGEQRRFASVILIALHVYRPPIAAGDVATLGMRRERIKQSIQAGESTFARQITWDRALGLLFPELASGLKHEAGTASYSDKVSATNRKELDVRKHAEAAQAEAEKTRVEISRALDSISRRLAWTVADGSMPVDVATAVRFIRRWRTRGSGIPASKDHETVESAWDARSRGVSIRSWIESRQPASAAHVEELARFLEESWLGLKQA